MLVAITINIYYSGTNGGAREFAKEMIASGIVEAIRAEKGFLSVKHVVRLSIIFFASSTMLVTFLYHYFSNHYDNIKTG